MARRLFLILFAGATIFGGVGLLVQCRSDSRERTALRQTIDELAAGGYFAEPERPPAVPEAENAAPIFLDAARRCVRSLPSEAVKGSSKKSRWINWYRFRWDGYASLDAEEKACADRWFAANAEAVSIALKADGRPHCVFPLDANGWIIDGKTPAQTALMDLGTLLADYGQLSLERGHVADAVVAFRTALRIADGMRSDKSLIGAITSGAVVQSVANAIALGTSRDLSADDLTRLLEWVPRPETLRHGIPDECRESLRRWPDFALKEAEAFGSASATMKERLWMLDLKRVIDAEDRPLAERMTLYEQLAQAGRSCEYGFGSWFPGAGDSEALTACRLAVVRAGLEFEIHHATHGRYPETCDAVDPVTGRPLILNVDRGILYSLGANRTDERGDERDRRDIVWHLRHP